MLNKKLLGIITSAFLLAGSVNLPNFRANVQETAGDPIGQAYSQNAFYEYGGPADLSMANEEKVIEMLKKEGKIGKNASYEAAHKAYVSFLNQKAKGNAKDTVTKLERDLKAKRNLAMQENKTGIQKVKSQGAQAAGSEAALASTALTTGPKTVNILCVLAEYSDFKHNSIKTGETEMFYTDYNKQHFQDMLFGTAGYTGPSGQNFISMKQYYDQQSHGSLVVNGTVAGWYPVANTATYYGGNDANGNDVRPRDLIKDALAKVAVDPTINLADFDKEDRYDADGDGNYNEPDGVIDYLMVIHSGIGEEAGGGSLGANAIWSHRWNLGAMYQIPGTSYKAYDYTVEPEDGAAGVFAHEYGHDLGLPDEYDTNYSSDFGEPIAQWSIMSGGSWSGIIGGTEPTGFSPYAKEYFQAAYGGNWQQATVLDFNALTTTGTSVNLRQATDAGQAVRVNLPDRAHKINTPYSGSYEYWGGTSTDGKTLKNSMSTTVSLAGARRASLSFKTWYDIENGWDFASVQVRPVGTTAWTALRGNITTSQRASGATVVVANGITGKSNGWVTGTFDLSAYKGKNIELKLEYECDNYTYGAGFYVDDVQVTADSVVKLTDNAEGTAKFTLNGFAKDTGAIYASNYYLVEWRNHSGVDIGLAKNSAGGKVFVYDPGMVVWYVDNYYTDNWTGTHPGNGYLGIVDADQNNLSWIYTSPNQSPTLASGRYQMHDAAFSMNTQAVMNLDLTAAYGKSLVDNNRTAQPLFSDSTSYLNTGIPALGRDIPKLGLKVQITYQAADNSYADIIFKK